MGRVLFAIALLTPLCMTAQDFPGKHPGYYAAITDLNWARAIVKSGMDQGPAGADEQRAINEITAAMVAIHSAELDNGYNPPGQPNADVQYPPQERFRRVLELLSKARKGIGREEDNPDARRLRNSAWLHIDAAMSNIRDAQNYWR
jgi:hypothetical protein